MQLERLESLKLGIPGYTGDVDDIEPTAEIATMLTTRSVPLLLSPTELVILTKGLVPLWDVVAEQGGLEIAACVLKGKFGDLTEAATTLIQLKRLYDELADCLIDKCLEIGALRESVPTSNGHDDSATLAEMMAGMARAAVLGTHSDSPEEETE